VVVCQNSEMGEIIVVIHSSQLGSIIKNFSALKVGWKGEVDFMAQTFYCCSRTDHEQSSPIRIKAEHSIVTIAALFTEKSAIKKVKMSKAYRQ